MENTVSKDINFEEYKFEPKIITENNQTVIDYTGVQTNKIFLVNKKDILTKPRPQWMPELDVEGLKEDSFLPVTVHDDKGNYYVQGKVKIGEYNSNARFPIFEKKIYKMSLDVLAATVDYYLKHERAIAKEQGKKTNTIALPRALNSMRTSRYNDYVELLPFCENYASSENAYKIFAKKRNLLQTTIVFTEQHQPLLQQIKDKKLDLDLQKIDYANTYAKGEETSYGKENRNSILDNYGIKIRKQNGTTFKIEEINNLEKTVKDSWQYFGDLSQTASDYDLTVSYADNCYQHARKAIGLFSPFYEAIGVSFLTDEKRFPSDRVRFSSGILAHEITHWLDNQKGDKLGNWYASDKFGTTENKIAQEYKNLLRENIEKLNRLKTSESRVYLEDYWFRTCECLARAVEQNFAIKHGIKYEELGYLPEDIYRERIQPMVQELLNENREYFKLKEMPSIKNDQTQTQNKNINNEIEENKEITKQEESLKENIPVSEVKKDSALDFVLDKIKASGIEVNLNSEVFNQILSAQNVKQMMQVSFENIEDYFKPDEEDYKNYITQIDEYLADSSNELKMITVGKISPVMRILGINDLPIEMPHSVVSKALRPEPLFKTDKQGHNLNIDTIKSIPELLSNPLMIFKSDSPTRKNDDSYVFFTEKKDKEGRTVIIPLAVNIKYGRLRINEITSIYGRNNEVDYVKNNITNGNLMYFDEKKCLEWERECKIQFLTQVLPQQDYSNIMTKDKLVNFLSGTTQKLTMDWVSEKEVDYPPIRTAKDIIPLLNNYTQTPQEIFMAVSLDAKYNPISCRIISVGTMDQALVHPRDVFREAIKDNAHSIIIAHNHPSGNIEPSQPDIKTTQRIVEAGNLLGIQVLDSIITSPKKIDYFSFTEHNLIQNMKEQGITYGFIWNNKMYLDPNLLSVNVAIHEYTHLWDACIQSENPELWNKGKKIFSKLKLWDEIKNNPDYADISNNEDLLMSEVHSRISGKMAEKILERIEREEGKITKDTVINWNAEAWKYIAEEFNFDFNKDFDMFTIEGHSLTSEELHTFTELLSRPMKELINEEKIILKEKNALDDNLSLSTAYENTKENIPVSEKKFDSLNKEFEISDIESQIPSLNNKLSGRNSVWFKGQNKTVKDMLDFIAKNGFADFSLEKKEDNQLYIQGYDNGWKPRGRMNVSTEELKYLDSVLQGKGKTYLNERYTELTGRSLSDVVYNPLAVTETVEIQKPEQKTEPFIIVYNEEKGRVNIKFNPARENPYFKDIIKELKANNWKYAPSQRQWYPMDAENSKRFADSLFEKYSELLISGESVNKTSSITENTVSDYSGLKFFDRNYEEGKDFMQYFNEHLSENQNPISLENAKTILKALNHEETSVISQRRDRLALDENNVLTIVSKEDSNVTREHTDLNGLLKIARDKAEQELKAASDLFKANEEKKAAKTNELDFGNIYETVLENAKKTYEEMNEIFDSYYIGNLQSFEAQMEYKKKLLHEKGEPCVEVTFSESTEGKRLEKGTVLTLFEADTYYPNKNDEFKGSYLKTDFTLYLKDRNGEDLSYNGQIDIGTDYDAEPFTDYLRKMCSYDEVLAALEYNWEKTNAPNLTEWQRGSVEYVLEPLEKFLQEEYKKEQYKLKEIREKDKSLYNSYIIDTGEMEKIENQRARIKNEIKALFDGIISSASINLKPYLETNNSKEYENYVVHKIKNMLQDAKYSESRKGRSDYDYYTWRESLETVTDASQYDRIIREEFAKQKELEAEHKELKNGDVIGICKVSNVIKIADGVYQANIKDNLPDYYDRGNHFILEKTVAAALSPEIHKLLDVQGNMLVVENKYYDPYVCLEMIEKKVMPPRDEKYLQNLKDYVNENPLSSTIFKQAFSNGITEDNIAKIDLLDKWNKTLENFTKNVFSKLSKDEQKEIKNWFAKLEINPDKKSVNQITSSLLSLLPEKTAEEYRKTHKKAELIKPKEYNGREA